jgi:hypothetical protein
MNQWGIEQRKKERKKEERKKEREMNTANILKSLQSGLIKDEVSLLCECCMLEIDY